MTRPSDALKMTVSPFVHGCASPHLSFRKVLQWLVTEVQVSRKFPDRAGVQMEGLLILMSLMQMLYIPLHCTDCQRFLRGRKFSWKWCASVGTEEGMDIYY